MKMGKGGGWLRKSFFSDLESGKVSIHVNQGREVVQTRDYGDFFKVSTKTSTCRLWYYHASNGPGGLSSGEKKEEKKGRFFHSPLAVGERAAGRLQ